MKSSYELAMERLNKKSPSTKMTEAKKKELAELDSLYAAKMAEKELFVKGEMEKAREKGDFEAYQSLERQLVADRKNLQADLDEKKDKIRERK